MEAEEFLFPHKAMDIAPLVDILIYRYIDLIVRAVLSYLERLSVSQ